MPGTLIATAKIAGRGRIYIPREVRESLSLEDGDIVGFRLLNERVVLEKLK